jgi:predicted phage terminase large subunit-like protein
MDAAESLIAFTEYTLPEYEAANHHRLIAERLEAVERGEIDRLMIFMPPRHGKSELASRRFPAWCLGRNPKRNIIAASYNSDLATDFGREVRNIVASTEYGAVFDTSLAQDNRAANRWNTNSGGAYVAAGVGTAVTGRGAHILLIDDPLKDREEADSELRRQRVWDWYTSTAYTRLAPGGAVVLIQTRWHEDDLAGRLLDAQETGGDQWEVLSLPALDGDKPLWPEWYDKRALERIRDAIGPRDWSALYQQSPAPDEGSYFKREWLQYYDKLPDSVYTYGGSDYAVTDNGGDYTVHLTAAMDGDGNIYVTDLWRQQTTPDKWIDAWLDMVERHEPLTWAEEQGQIIKSVGPFIDRQMQERGIYCAREQFTSVADKPTRARAFQARMASGKVYLPQNAPWLADFINELLTFPAGKNDDQVDAASIVFRLLADMTSKGIVPTPEKRDRWDKVFDDDTGDANWKTV